MSFAQCLSLYAGLNALLVVALASLCMFSLMRPNAREELRLHYAALVFVLVWMALLPAIPGPRIFEAPTKLWSAESIRSFDPAHASGFISLAPVAGKTMVRADHLAETWLALLALSLLLGTALLFRDVLQLIRIRKTSITVRRIGKVRLMVNDSIAVPFSFWWPGRAFVIIPSAILEQPADLRMILAHEAQHHRQGDTRLVYFFWILRWLCPFNPAVHLWNQWISRLQEFACDETLVDQKNVDSRAYARCLIEVAKTAVDWRRRPISAMGLVFRIERQILKRRIEKMFFKTQTEQGKSATWIAGVLLAVFLGATAFASKSLIQDRRVSLEQARAMAAQAAGQDGFPIVVNDLVLKQLNRFLGTPEGRQFMRDSLARMHSYQGGLNGFLAKYDIPPEILAVGVTESGYRNLADGENHSSNHATGIWQFIPSTARRFGLVVNDRRDERMDFALSTDAAFRYLKINQLFFKDWLLSILSYNMGEKAVQRAMNTLHTRDPWVLIRHGFENDKNYLPRVMAAILIMRNPQSLD